MTANFKQTHIENIIIKNTRRFVDINQKNFTNKCDLCKKIKFERASHCSICQVCVVRRDHHCPWIKRCVGYSNLQYFLNYCIWTWIAGLHYISGFVNFYDSEFQRIKTENDNSTNMVLKIFTYFYSLIMISGTLGITMIIVSQINYIYNDYSFNEKRKSPLLESYYPCCISKNLESKQVNNP